MELNRKIQLKPKLKVLDQVLTPKRQKPKNLIEVLGSDAGMDEKKVKVINELGISEDKDESNFRISAKKIALTYAQCPIEKEYLFEELKKVIKITKYLIGREHHKDGNFHLHAFIESETKIESKNCRFLDILWEGKTYHPNIRSVTNQEKWIDYCSKDMDYIDGGIDRFSTSSNFKKKKSDLESWIAHRQYLRLSNTIYPIDFKTFHPKVDHVWNEGAFGEKCDSVMIIGDPDLGKTTWIQNTFEGQKVYMRPTKSKYPYEDYKDEDIIIVDDSFIGLDEIKNVLNFYKLKTHVFGDVRYNGNYWKLRHVRRFIFLLNDEPDYIDNPAFKARVKVFDVRTIKEEEPSHNFVTLPKGIRYLIEDDEPVYVGDDVNDYL